MSADNKKKPITFMADNQELKDAYNLYAKKRGFKNAAAMAQAAFFEYIRRRPWKNAPAVLHKAVGCDFEGNSE